jgi:CHAD domain-containing protein
VSHENDIIAAWRTIDRLRFAPEHEIHDMRVALREIRDNLEILLA